MYRKRIRPVKMFKIILDKPGMHGIINRTFHFWIRAGARVRKTLF